MRRSSLREPIVAAPAATLVYVNEHTGRQDTVVKLAMALAPVGGMLAERLPA